MLIMINYICDEKIINLCQIQVYWPFRWTMSKTRYVTSVCSFVQMLQAAHLQLKVRRLLWSDPDHPLDADFDRDYVL